MPSKPRDSIRTLSPTSKPRPARLALRANTSDVRLGGRGAVSFAEGVRPALTAEEEDADEEGRMLAFRESMLPEKDADEEGESWEKERSLARGARCCAGSLARMASAKAFDA